MNGAVAMDRVYNSGLSIAELVQELGCYSPQLSGSDDVSVTGVRQDSRRICPGDLFVARSGASTDGVAFVPDAIARGAVAVMSDTQLDPGVSVIRVSDASAALGTAAHAVYRQPSHRVPVVGITGTNGKTTVSFLVQHALTSAGFGAARLGTLGYALGRTTVETGLTTPGADDVARFMASAAARECQAFVMEVSSHALSQHRVDDVRFDVAAFTNFTQDHLDYHASMAEYRAAKWRLFTDLSPRVSVVNVDSEVGAELYSELKAASREVLSVGRAPSADVRPIAVVQDVRGTRGMVQCPSGSVDIDTRLIGEHSLENLLVALGIFEALGVDVRNVASVLPLVPQVPGRLERCDVPVDDVCVVVDYAHTPDALRRALTTARGLTSGQVVCVFGCGGDRDTSKRPKMGAIVSELADVGIVTNDNPRTEDPVAIADAIRAGMPTGGAAVTVQLDRRSAIEQAVQDAKPGDVVLIAGKGHEPYQLVGGRTLAFDDRYEARRALSLRREGQHGV